MVYLPFETPSNSSSSSSEIHCGVSEAAGGCKDAATHSAGKVHLHGEDADILGTGREDDVVRGAVERDGHGGGQVKEGSWRND